MIKLVKRKLSTYGVNRWQLSLTVGDGFSRCDDILEGIIYNYHDESKMDSDARELKTAALDESNYVYWPGNRFAIKGRNGVIAMSQPRSQPSMMDIDRHVVRQWARESGDISDPDGKAKSILIKLISGGSFKRSRIDLSCTGRYAIDGRELKNEILELLKHL